MVIKDTIRNIFMNLSNVNLLKKCLHGKTQTNNEGINVLIWKVVQKIMYLRVVQHQQ